MILKRTCIGLLAGMALLILVLGILLNPIPQPEAYHNFADQRSGFDVANAMNVLNEIPEPKMYV